MSLKSGQNSKAGDRCFRFASTFLGLGLATLLLLSADRAVAQAVSHPPGDGRILECQLLGGEVVPQPPGSSITACCYENGCWICDADGNDCEFEPAGRTVRPFTTFQTPPVAVPLPAEQGPRQTTPIPRPGFGIQGVEPSLGR